ncbi:hypothetical protein WN51_01241 [Melipona quadrifasciata]|uniref:Uncharacterized protein n=1 Tax=Melipona quadrifasciata TaxID=166423 RepID=A0A0N0BFL4_9HYME|nr:hypothetical protein WN51_01241 [Melipona quadrifasciata]
MQQNMCEKLLLSRFLKGLKSSNHRVVHYDVDKILKRLLQYTKHMRECSNTYKNHIGEGSKKSCRVGTRMHGSRKGQQDCPRFFGPANGRSVDDAIFEEMPGTLCGAEGKTEWMKAASQWGVSDKDRRIVCDRVISELRRLPGQHDSKLSLASSSTCVTGETLPSSYLDPPSSMFIFSFQDFDSSIDRIIEQHCVNADPVGLRGDADADVLFCYKGNDVKNVVRLRRWARYLTKKLIMGTLTNTILLIIISITKHVEKIRGDATPDTIL